MAAATPTGEVRLKRREDWQPDRHRRRRASTLAAKSDGSARLRHRRASARPAVRGDPPLPDARRQPRRGRRRAGARAAPASSASSASAPTPARRGARGRRPDQLARAARRRRDQGRVAAAAGGRRSTRARSWPSSKQRARARPTRDGGFAFHSRGDVAGADAGAARHVEQIYRAPYLAHATMEPINCTARVADGKVEVWAPTQVPGLARAIAAAGRRRRRRRRHASTSPTSAAASAAASTSTSSARRCASRIETGGRPVQLVWSREEDLTHDFYRPAGGRDAARRPRRRRLAGSTLRITSAGDAITPRWMERGIPPLAGPVDTPDKTTSEGLFDQLYGVPHQRIAHVATRSGVPVGYWRSVGHSHNAFFVESFVDELAHAAGQRPGRLPARAARRTRRAIAAVLRLAAERAGWPGHGRRGRCRRDVRAASRCTRASAASSRRSSRRRSSTAGRACIASSAPPTSAPSSTRASSPSRWKAR